MAELGMEITLRITQEDWWVHTPVYENFLNSVSVFDAEHVLRETWHARAETFIPKDSADVFSYLLFDTEADKLEFILVYS